MPASSWTPSLWLSTFSSPPFLTLAQSSSLRQSPRNPAFTVLLHLTTVNSSSNFSPPSQTHTFHGSLAMACAFAPLGLCISCSLCLQCPSPGILHPLKSSLLQQASPDPPCSLTLSDLIQSHVCSKPRTTPSLLTLYALATVELAPPPMATHRSLLLCSFLMLSSLRPCISKLWP